MRNLSLLGEKRPARTTDSWAGKEGQDCLPLESPGEAVHLEHSCAPRKRKCCHRRDAQPLGIGRQGHPSHSRLLGAKRGRKRLCVPPRRKTIRYPSPSCSRAMSARNTYIGKSAGAGAGTTRGGRGCQSPREGEGGCHRTSGGKIHGGTGSTGSDDQGLFSATSTRIFFVLSIETPCRSCVQPRVPKV